MAETEDTKAPSRRTLSDAEMEAAEWLARAGGSAPGLEYIPRRRSALGRSQSASEEQPDQGNLDEG